MKRLSLRIAVFDSPSFTAVTRSACVLPKVPNPLAPSLKNLPHPPRPQLGTFDGLADTIPSFFDLL